MSILPWISNSSNLFAKLLQTISYASLIVASTIFSLLWQKKKIFRKLYRSDNSHYVMIRFLLSGPLLWIRQSFEIFKQGKLFYSLCYRFWVGWKNPRHLHNTQYITFPTINMKSVCLFKYPFRNDFHVISSGIYFVYLLKCWRKFSFPIFDPVLEFSSHSFLPVLVFLQPLDTIFSFSFIILLYVILNLQAKPTQSLIWARFCLSILHTVC